MAQNTKTSPRLDVKGAIGKAWSGYSYIFIFAIIFVIFLICNGGTTWNGVMNILRHSGVVGIIALGMGLVQRKSKSCFLPYLWTNHHMASSRAMAPPWLARPPFQGMKISQKPCQEPK